MTLHPRPIVLLGLSCLLTSVAATRPTPRGPGAASPPEPPVHAQFRGGPDHTGVVDTRGLDGYGGILWRVALPGPIRSTPAVSDGVVYVGSAGGWLHALDREDGTELWRYRTGAAVHGSPAVSGGLVFVTDMEGTLYAVDRATGVGVWKVQGGPTIPWPWGHESGDVFASSPTLADVGGATRVFWGAADGVVRAADPETGTVLWSLATGGRVRSTPAVADGRVVVGSADGRVYCADAESGRLLWRHDTRGTGLFSGDFGFDRRTVQSSPAIANGRVYVGARDGWLYALDLGSGGEVWSWDDEVSWVNGSPAVAEGRVFSATSDRRWIHALDAASGRELWRVMTDNVVWTSPVVVGTSVYWSAGDGVVRALAAADGSVRWQATLPAPSHGSATVDDGVLFVGTEDGGFYALRDGAGHTLRRAVFWDSTTANAGWYAGGHDLAAYLGRAGYETLDVAGLAPWMEAGVAGGDPGSVVFAQSWLPEAVRAGGDGSLFRRYLDAGGTVVWASLPPDVWRRDPATGAAGGLDQVDWERPERLLGISVAGAIFDRAGAWSTEEGRALGLPDAWISSWNVPAQAGLEPLAVDENGAYAAFRKRYGGPPGTGFVRVWGSSGTSPSPAPFLLAAEWRPAGR
jgi:outer membrane protein assembly factor BamB